MAALVNTSVSVGGVGGTTTSQTGRHGSVEWKRTEQKLHLTPAVEYTHLYTLISVALVTPTELLTQRCALCNRTRGGEGLD